jgi:hypothetical protein
MARDKDQVMMFSKAELSIIKNTFAGNDDLLFAVRKVLLQFPVSEYEQQILKEQINPEVMAVLKKRILPDLDPDAPLNQLADIRVTMTEMLKTRQPDENAVLFAAMDVGVTYIEQQLQKLSGYEVEEKIKLADLRQFSGSPVADCFDTQARLQAYLFILGYIDPRLLDLKIMAGIKEETPEEQEKRLKRDSTK